MDLSYSIYNYVINMIVFEQFFVLTHENVQIPDILFLLPNSRWKSRLTIYMYIYL